MNRFGRALVLELEGTSHGPGVGATVTGLPPGIAVELADVQALLDRRRPVGRRWATKRQEEDRLVLDEGIEAGRTTGGPVRGHVENRDVDRGPYDRLRDTPRPGHADYPARVRYGPDADLSGGGPFSGRMTVGLVFAGGLANALLRPRGIAVAGFTKALGGIVLEVPEELGPAEIHARRAGHEMGALDDASEAAMESRVAEVRREGDSVGGVVEVRATGVPVGLGEPFFDSIESELAHLLFAIPGVKAVEFGAGSGVAALRGSENNDAFRWRDGKVVPSTNRAGGILGGLATGAPVVVRAAVKPTPSIARPQATVNLRTGADAEIVVTGRHDPCIVPRAVVVAEAVVAFALADLGLRGGYLP